MELEQGFRPPELEPRELQDIIRGSYGLRARSVKKMDGYDDKNYYVEVSPDVDNENIVEVWPHGYVLKVMNSLDSKHETFVNAQHELMKHLNESGIVVPLPVKNIRGETYSVMKFSTENGHIVRLMTFIPGTILVTTESSYEKLRKIGEFVGILSLYIKDFKHEGYDKRDSVWFLGNVLRVRSYLNYIEDEEKLDMVKQILDEFETIAVPVSNTLDRVLIHGDLNENNLIVSGDEVTGLLDFGDSHYSYSIYELAICLCYMLLYAKEVEAGKPVIEGYLKLKDIEEVEKSILKTCVCARLCQSLVLGLYSHKQDPNNEYILSSQKAGWNILTKLCNLTNEELLEMWGIDSYCV